MIRRIQLKNWKAYDSLDIELKEGATFVVAQNGVGKSSLIQGTMWGLFGDAVLDFPIHEAVRHDANKANASVSVALPSGAELVIHRTILIGANGRATSHFAAEVDSRPITEEDVLALLRVESGLDVEHLRRITLLKEGAIIQELDPAQRFNLPNYVDRVFGLQDLETAAESLSTRTRRAIASGDRQRRDVDAGLELRRSTRASRFAAIEAELSQAASRRIEIDQQIARTGSSVAVLQQWRNYRVQSERSEAGRASIRLRLEDVTGAEIDEEAIEPQLADHLDAFARDLDLQRSDVARYEAELSLVREALALLDRSGAICPVCGRPMSPDEVRTARSNNENELTRISDALNEASSRLEFARLRQQSLMSIEKDLRSVVAPIRPPIGDAEGDEEALAAMEIQLRSELQAVDEGVGQLQQEKKSLEQAEQHDIELANANMAAVRSYREAEVASLLAGSLRRTASVIRERQLSPLVSELQTRWKSIWPDRSGLQLRSDGALTLEGRGRVIEYAHFSGAEKTLSLVALRLLLVEMTSSIRMLWLDEPLEHLDSRNRRKLASLLMSTTASGAFRQIVVTTYEEAVVRRLSERFRSSGSEVVYVRASTP